MTTSRPSPTTRQVVAGAALGVLAACVAPMMRPYDTGVGEPRTVSEVELPPVEAERTSQRTLVLPRTVRVRLADLDGRSVVEVLDPSGAPISLRWAPSQPGMVYDSSGRKRAQWTLNAPSQSALRIGSNAYPGRLVVRPHPRSGLRVHNEVDLERYVAGVVAAELPIWSAPPAELEAQAIAARTYAAATLAARSARDEAAELVDGVLDQAYRGLFQPDSDAALQVARRLDAAVEATRGVVLARGAARGAERLEEARFHASCGGHTANFSDVFPEVHVPGSLGRPCAPCAKRVATEAASGGPDGKRPLGWSHTVPQEALARASRELGLAGPIRALGPKRLDPNGRWIDAQLVTDGGVSVVPFDDLRAALGYGQVKSARLVRAWPPFGRTIESGLRLEGVGRGHGVGLCQEGARDLARDGWSAKQILAHYYPGARLVRPTLGDR